MEWLRDLFEAAQRLDPKWLYPVLLVSSYVENIFPPLPGDTVTAFGAYLVGRGVLKLGWVVVATVVGSVGGFMTLYALAYSGGRAILRRKRVLSDRRVRRAQRWIDRYGDKVVLLNRFLPGLRSTVAVLVGLGGMRPRKVLAFSLLSASVWNGLLIYAGFLLGTNWEAIGGILRAYTWAVGTFLGAIAVGWLGLYLFRRYRAQLLRK